MQDETRRGFRRPVRRTVAALGLAGVVVAGGAGTATAATGYVTTRTPQVSADQKDGAPQTLRVVAGSGMPDATSSGW
ncbi:hypothetical protein [Rhodococcus sp. HNM0569]|uniref:hypothetical protein n=1 Tax=Rhodococcus sp. HNM0569 TaxID=2716340 RepID=UPI00146ADB87|nr:hypothetical protein [Rhodococcus sp. HNM0569]NLU82774.1 hypothetical protein [Rhodococcus sp. HNM0569]